MSPEDFKLVRSLFHDAFDLSAGDAAAMLERECAGRDDLRNEVESLLRANKTANNRSNPFESSIAQQLLTKAAGWDNDDVEQIGPYQIVRRIGQGGMGVVYLARQRHPEREVALKVLRGSVVPTSMRRRFEREIRLLGQLHHPGIAQIFEAGVTDGQDVGGRLPYFAMEYVDGQPLTDYANAKGLSTSDRLELFAKICDAVQHAHQKGVIHRDLKPANILVVDEVATDGTVGAPVGRPKILDFGVARLTDADIHTVTMQTDAGQLIGTVPYMSPEQVLGDAGMLDARSDIYSLGVVLFELLSGRRPYDLSGRSLAEAARIIVEQEPTSLGSIATALRGDLDTIVLKALEKEKSRRYLSAADLGADVRRYLNDEPIAARPQTTFYLFRKFARRNRGVVIASAALAVSLVVGLVVVSILAHREGQQRRIAERIAYRASIGSASALLANHDVASARMSLEKAPEYLRGWEWRYFWNHLDDSLRSIDVDAGFRPYAFMNQSGEILLTRLPWFSPFLRRLELSVAPTPSESDEQGVLFYGQSSRGMASLWITSDGKLHIQLPRASSAHTIVEPICRPSTPKQDLWYLPSDDGRLVLFQENTTKQICVMDVESGEHFTRFVDLEEWNHKAVFVGGDWVASPIFNCQCIELWNFRTNQTRTFAKHPATLECISVSPDGASLYTGSQDSMLRRWNVQSGELEAIGQGHSGYLVHFACSPDGRVVATASTDNTVRLWDASTLQSRRVYHGHASTINSLAFSPDGTKVVSMTTAATRNIRVWDAASREPDVRKNHRGYVYSVTFSPDGRRILSAGWDGYFNFPGGIKIWDAETFDPITEVGDSGNWYYYAAFSPDGKRFAISGANGLSIHDAATGQALIRRKDAFGVGNSLAFDPAGHRVLCAGKFVDSATGEDLPCQIERAALVSWSGDGRLIATHSDEPNAGIRLWDAKSQRKVQELSGPRQTVWNMAFSLDGKLLASTSEEPPITLVWSTDDGRLLASLETPGGGALCAAFSPDGTRLATGARDQVIHLWDTKSFEDVAQLHGHNAYVKSLAWSPDGTTLLSGSGDGTIRIWDANPFRSDNAGPEK